MNPMKLMKKACDLYQRKYKTIEYARRLGVQIGDNCRLITCPNFGSEPYLIEIGNHVTISAEVAFVNHDGGTWVFREEEKYRNVIKFGKIVIGNNCFIGMRSMIMPGVTIGDNCVVGACSLVTKSIPSGEIWGGIPARFITTTEEYAEKCMRNSPLYDIDNMKKNKKQELLRIMNADK